MKLSELKINMVISEFVNYSRNYETIDAYAKDKKLSRREASRFIGIGRIHHRSRVDMKLPKMISHQFKATGKVHSDLIMLYMPIMPAHLKKMKVTDAIKLIAKGA